MAASRAEMKTLRVHGGACLQGTTAVPGDKSISHRAVMLASLATGTSTIGGFVPARDCLATVRAMRALGVPITVEQSPGKRFKLGLDLIVRGVGPRGLQPPKNPIDCGGSATTMRLLAGVLAAQPFSSMLTGNTQLLARPMGRIVRPLQRMGATIRALGEGNRPPLAIHPAKQLRGAIIHTPIASAQVKSCLLLAGLFAQGKTTVVQPCVTRDHTERLMRSLGVCVHNQELEPTRVSICPPSLQPELSRMDTAIPGDMSSAAFLIAAAAVCANSRVTIQHVGLNSTRTGFLNALRRMGIQRECREHVDHALDDAREPVGDVTIRSAPLRGIHVPLCHLFAKPQDKLECPFCHSESVLNTREGQAKNLAALRHMERSFALALPDDKERRGDNVDAEGVGKQRDAVPVAMIDELPLLAVVATQARGVTLVRQAAELRVKETDRITGIAEELCKLGGDIQELPDGFRVQGPTPLRGATVDSRGDHRLAMALAVAGLCAQGQTTVVGAECVDDSFPGFADCLRRLGARVEETEVP